MKIKIFLCLVIVGFFSTSIAFASVIKEKNMTISLPKPSINKTIFLDQAIEQRRSIRSFKDKTLSQEQVSQLLWAAQGITDKNRMLRASPSAGALYPLHLYVVKNDGVWSYSPQSHAIKNIIDQDLRSALSATCLHQEAIKQAAINIVIAADYNVIARKYGDRAERYTHMEVGHAAQNILLEAVALGLSSVPIGAIDDDAVKKLLKLPNNQVALYVLPVGYKS